LNDEELNLCLHLVLGVNITKSDRASRLESTLQAKLATFSALVNRATFTMTLKLQNVALIQDIQDIVERNARIFLHFENGLSYFDTI
jgi:hypothetical protein